MSKASIFWRERGLEKGGEREGERGGNKPMTRKWEARSKAFCFSGFKSVKKKMNKNFFS